MFSWFNAKEFQRFGEELAVLFIADKPSVLEGNRQQRRASKGKAKNSEPVQVALRKLVTRISTFEERKQANIYKKAKFANAFKWKLMEAGFDAEFADELTRELVLHFR